MCLEELRPRLAIAPPRGTASTEVAATLRLLLDGFQCPDEERDYWGGEEESGDPPDG